MLVAALLIAGYSAAALPIEPAAPAPYSSNMTLGAPVAAPMGYLRFCLRRPDQCDLPDPSQGKGGEALNAVIQNPSSETDGLQPASIGPSRDETETSEAQGDHSVDAAALGRTDQAEAEPEAPSAPAAPTPALSIRLTSSMWAALVAVNDHINASIRPMSDEQAFGVSNYWTLPLSDGPRPVGNCKHYALEKRKALVEAGVPTGALSLAIVRTPSGELHAVLIVESDQGELVLDNLTSRIRGWRDTHYTWLARQTPGHPLDWVSVAG